VPTAASTPPSHIGRANRLARRLRCNPLPLGARDAPRCCNTLETAKHSAEPSAAPTARPVVTAARGGWPEVDRADRGVIGTQSAGYRALPWRQPQGQLGPARLGELVFVNDMQPWPTDVRIGRRCCADFQVLHCQPKSNPASLRAHCSLVGRPKPSRPAHRRNLSDRWDSLLFAIDEEEF
jgi:hypothetical protein